MANQNAPTSTTVQSPVTPTGSDFSISLDIAETVSALTWPILIAFVIWAFRKNISDILTNLKIKKIDFSGLSLEFAEASSTPALRNSEFSRKSDIDFDQEWSWLESLNTQKYDYVRIELCSREDLSTSRLYIWSILFKRLVGINILLFVDNSKAGRPKYIGWIEADKIRWSLAQKYPYLEEAFADAYAKVISFVNGSSKIANNRGKLKSTNKGGQDPNFLLVKEILSRLQPHNGWFKQGDWLDSGILINLLGDALFTIDDSIKLEDYQKISGIDQLTLIMRTSPKYIAVTKDDGIFDRLIDRDVLLKKMAEEIGKDN